MKKLSVLSTILVMTILSVLAESFHYDPHSKTRLLPSETKETSVDVKEDQTGVTVTYSLGDLFCAESQTLPGYYSVHLDWFGVNDDDGLPDVPFRVDQFELPKNADYASVILLNADSIHIPLKVAAASLPIPSSYYPQAQSSTDKAAWRQGANGKDALAKLHYNGLSGDTRRIGVEVAPVQYDPVKEEVIVYYSFQYRIEFEHLADPTSTDGPLSTIATNEVINYLIISTPTFQSVLKDFVKWKKQCGFTIGELYRDDWTHTSVMSSVDSVYHATKNLKYLLIVGDNAAVPGVPRSFNGWREPYGPSKYATDFPYSCLDGDSIPEIYVGRIPARSRQEAKNALTKILNYEKTPPTDPTLYSTAIHTGIFTQGSSIYRSNEPFVYTCEMIRDYVSDQGVNCIRNYSAPSSMMPKYWPAIYGNGKEIPAELQRPNFSWNGMKDDINNAVNNGVLYALNCGHGLKNYWVCSASDPEEYTASDADALTNKNFPIFFNMSCWTGFYGDVRGGTYYNVNDRSLTQALLGSKSSSGAVAVFAASEMSAMGKNDAMTVGFFNGIWPSPGFNCVVDTRVGTYSTPKPNKDTPTLGNILKKGQEFITAHFGYYAAGALHEARVMHLFGDPSMRVNTEVPTEFENVEITALPLFPLSDSDVSTETKLSEKKVKLTLTIKDKSQPRISLIDKYGKQTAYTGHHIIVPNVTLPIEITVTAHNKIPYHYTRNALEYYFPGVKIISISPNPVTSQTVIKIGPERIGDNLIHKLYDKFSLVVYSLTGNYIAHTDIPEKEDQVTLSCEGLKKGTHIIALYGDNQLLDSQHLIIR